ncbi:MAG: DNA primase [Tepidanaerobacteraceae bacterium]|jgi:DNA primase|nr:DNA primase [Tepidanaerobacteraceae bacterium]
MGFYSEDILSEIRSSADIVDVISQYVSLQKRGDNYVGLCPFHSEKTPSFHVSAEKQLFYCFGCGAGGNVFTFLMKKENINFPEAVRLLADRLNINLPPNEYERGTSREFRQRREQLRLNKMASEYYHNVLLNTRDGKRGLEYLKKRGITLETIERFRLGYAPPLWDGLIKHFQSMGVDANTLAKLGLAVAKKNASGFYDRFRDRIIFPIEDAAKNVVGFGGRIIGPGEPKYLNSPETPVFSKGENLYAISMIKKDPALDVIIVEGYMDCISLQQSGFTQTVATLGTALTPMQAKLLKNYTGGVILAYDTDSAGQAATMRGMEILAREGLNVRVLRLAEEKDPDEFIRKKGREAFERQLSEALYYIDYKLYLAKNDTDITAPEGKIKYIKKAVEVLCEIENKVEREVYLQKISSELNIPAQALKDEIIKKRFPDNGFKYKKSPTRDNNKEFSKISPITGAYKAERLIIKLFVENEAVREKIAENLTPSYFLNERTRKIAGALFEMLRSQKPIEPDEIFNHLDQDASSELSGIIMTNSEFREDGMIDSLVKKIKENYLKHAIKQVREQIQKAEAVGEREETIILLNTYQKLKSQMDELKANLNAEKGGV